jgi:hypothetical protein
LRLLSTAVPGRSRFRPEADRWALRVLAGGEPPYGAPPRNAVAPDDPARNAVASAERLRHIAGTTDRPHNDIASTAA